MIFTHLSTVSSVCTSNWKITEVRKKTGNFIAKICLPFLSKTRRKMTIFYSKQWESHAMENTTQWQYIYIYIYLSIYIQKCWECFISSLWSSLINNWQIPEADFVVWMHLDAMIAAAAPAPWYCWKKKY